jgi:hypothetical protein
MLWALIDKIPAQMRKTNEMGSYSVCHGIKISNDANDISVPQRFTILPAG